MKKKYLLLSTVLSLAILSGCSNAEDKTIEVDGDTYVKVGEEYTRVSSFERKTFEPGTHIVYYTYHSDDCDLFKNGFGESDLVLPETPEGYKVINIVDAVNKKHDHTSGIIIFYVNDKTVEVEGEYNSKTGLIEYDKPGVVVVEKKLEMGD